MPDDPVGGAVAESIAGIFRWSTVELRYSPDDTAPRPQPDEETIRHALQRLEAALRARTAAGFSLKR